VSILCVRGIAPPLLVIIIPYCDPPLLRSAL